MLTTRGINSLPTCPLKNAVTTSDPVTLDLLLKALPVDTIVMVAVDIKEAVECKVVADVVLVVEASVVAMAVVAMVVEALDMPLAMVFILVVALLQDMDMLTVDMAMEPMVSFLLLVVVSFLVEVAVLLVDVVVAVVVRLVP